MNDTITKNLTAEMDVDEGERAFVAKITTDSLDRDNEVLLPTGMDATDFLKSPTVFWNHDYNRPLGRAVSLKQGRDEWTAKTVLAERPKNHEGEWFPDTVLSLMQQGVVRGVSVGFKPTQTRNPTKADRNRFGDDVQRVFSRWKILEYSVAPLPANQDALVEAVSKHIVGHAKALEMFPGATIPQQTEAPREPVTVEPVAKRTVLAGVEVSRRKVYFFVDEPLAAQSPNTVDSDAVAISIRREVARARGCLLVCPL